MPETVGGVVRNRDLVVLKSQNFFPGVFIGDSQKFILMKISSYSVDMYKTFSSHNA